MDHHRVRDALLQWFSKRQTQGVLLSEENNPVNDENADYVVSYEAVLEPPSLAQMRIEVWATADGFIGLGLERLSRIGKRAGVKCRRDRFAAGHEPVPMPESGFTAILDAIADGDVALSTRVVPFLGLISAKAVVREDVLQDLAQRGHSVDHWLRGVSSKEFRNNEDLLRFDKWV